MPDTFYSGHLNGAPSRKRPCTRTAVAAADYYDGHTSVEVESEPHIHAQKVHALLASIDAIDDTPQTFGEKEKREITAWLLHMARRESEAMMRSFAEESVQRQSNG